MCLRPPRPLPPTARSGSDQGEKDRGREKRKTLDRGGPGAGQVKSLEGCVADEVGLGQPFLVQCLGSLRPWGDGLAARRPAGSDTPTVAWGSGDVNHDARLPSRSPGEVIGGWGGRDERGGGRVRPPRETSFRRQEVVRIEAAHGAPGVNHLATRIGCHGGPSRCGRRARPLPASVARSVAPAPDTGSPPGPEAAQVLSGERCAAVDSSAQRAEAPAATSREWRRIAEETRPRGRQLSPAVMRHRRHETSRSRQESDLRLKVCPGRPKTPGMT